MVFRVFVVFELYAICRDGDGTKNRECVGLTDTGGAVGSRRFPSVELCHPVIFDPVWCLVCIVLFCYFLRFGTADHGCAQITTGACLSQPWKTTVDLGLISQAVYSYTAFGFSDLVHVLTLFVAILFVVIHCLCHL